MVYVQEMENGYITMVIRSVRYSCSQPRFLFYSSDSVHEYKHKRGNETVT